MIFDYYFAVVALTILASGALIVLIAGNNRLEKTKRILCIIAPSLSVFAATAEYLCVLLNGAPEWTRGIHMALKMFELSVSPMMVFCLVAAFNGFRSAKKIIPVAVVNLILQMVSGFTGLLYYMDADNVYQHGTLYFLYTMVYFVCGLIFFWECIKFSRHYQNRNFTSLLSILIFLVCGLSIHIVFSSIRADWLTIAISTSLFLNYYNVTSEQIDSLTQLLDRKSYDTHITSMNRKAVILMLDVDHFKEINDTYGHDTGDVCLRTVASAVLRAYSHYGYCYRIGGDEFCVVTRKTPDMSAANNAFYRELDRLRQSSGVPIPNVSFGCATFDPEIGTPHDAMKEADEAMYRAKNQSR